MAQRGGQSRTDLCFHLGHQRHLCYGNCVLHQQDTPALGPEACCLTLGGCLLQITPRVLGMRKTSGYPTAEFGGDWWLGVGSLEQSHQAWLLLQEGWPQSKEPASALRLTPCVLSTGPGQHFPLVFPPAQVSWVPVPMAVCMPFSLALVCLLPGMPEAALISAAGWFRCRVGGDLWHKTTPKLVVGAFTVFNFNTGHQKVYLDWLIHAHLWRKVITIWH